MICPNCKVSNYGKNKFCADCGTQLPEIFDAPTEIIPNALPQNPMPPINQNPPVLYQPTNEHLPPPQYGNQQIPPQQYQNQQPPPPQQTYRQAETVPPQIVQPQTVPPNRQEIVESPSETDPPKKKSKLFKVAVGVILIVSILFGGALLAMKFLIVNQANRSYVIGDKHQGEENKTLQFDAQKDRLFITNLDENKAQLWQITPDSGVEDSYRIVNRELGDVESLEVVDDKRDRAVSISESAEDDGQLWAITNVEGNYYRITNNWLGDSKALSHTKATYRFLRMRDSGNKEGQLWKRTPAKNGGYFITNKRYGDNFALEAIYQGQFTDKMKMAKSDDLGTQIWLMKPDGRGYFTLTTASHEYDKKNKSLDVDAAKNDRVRMADTGNFSGQKWKMIPVGGDYFRLTTEFLTDNKSLEAVTFYQYFIEMTKTSNEDKGQLWTIDRTN
ncbi:MAG TPA: RICIN domain-containing protein [Pyrinomonadaceae bacterium]|nr:RICIN domain-containing protein [Pyrinomonadaceae bacterium]